jgi:hypothetical protein
MNLQRVTQGQPLRIQSATWNALVDAARIVNRQGVRVGGDAIADTLTPTLEIWILNNVSTSGNFLPAGSVLSVGPPATTPFNFQDTPALTGNTPNLGGSTSNVICVTTEPIYAGAVGRAVVVGPVEVTVDVSDILHTRATTTNGTAKLVSTNSVEGYRIIWRESGTGERKAIVLLSARVDLPIDAAYDVSGIINTATRQFLGRGTKAIERLEITSTSSVSASSSIIHSADVSSVAGPLLVFCGALNTTANPANPLASVITPRYFLAQTSPGDTLPTGFNFTQEREDDDGDLYPRLKVAPISDTQGASALPVFELFYDYESLTGDPAWVLQCERFFGEVTGDVSGAINDITLGSEDA